MKDRLRTLYLDCSGIASLMVPTDTLLRGMLGYRDGDQPPPMLRKNIRINRLFAELRDVYSQLSYVADWRDAFVASPDLAVRFATSIIYCILGGACFGCANMI